MSSGHAGHGDAQQGHTPHVHAQPGSGSDLVFGDAFWDERYRSSARVWSGQPNPQLVAEAADLAPGVALDVGCGEGADAIWLARRGWTVTAVDFFAVALERGAAHAVGVGADVAERITWQQADLTSWLPPASTYDLVSAQFMHLPKAQREALFLRLAASVSPGGSLLIVGHAPSDLNIVPRPQFPEQFFTADEVADLLADSDWDICVSESRPRSVLDPEGREVTIHDATLKAHRT